MIVTTGDDVAGHVITRYLGLVRGIAHTKQGSLRPGRDE